MTSFCVLLKRQVLHTRENCNTLNSQSITWCLCECISVIFKYQQIDVYNNLAQCFFKVTVLLLYLLAFQLDPYGNLYFKYRCRMSRVSYNFKSNYFFIKRICVYLVQKSFGLKQLFMFLVQSDSRILHTSIKLFIYILCFMYCVFSSVIRQW